MPNQTQTQRVIKHVIAPIKRLWGTDFEESTINDFVDDLGGFSEETLQKAMDTIRREQKRCPSLAHVYEACRNYSPPKPKKESGERLHCRGFAEIDHPSVAREILERDAGKLALKLGVARDLINEYEVTGRKEFDIDFVRKCKKGLDSAANELAQCDANNEPGKSLHSLFEKMQEREKKLFSMFFTKIEQAA